MELDRTPTFEDVNRGLLSWASGSNADLAAVDLLISHETWLHRRDFRSYIKHYPETDVHALDLEGLVKARRNNDFPASGSELTILDLALSLLVQGYPFSARSVVGLDSVNTLLACAALSRAAGHPASVSQTLLTDQD